MFNKKVLTVAVQAAIVISAASMTQGCNLVEGANSVTSTGPVFSQVNAPKGSVSGYVQDTNGNPIAGAKVYLGAKVGTTNAGGMYSFSNVPVTNTANLSDDTTTQALVLSVVADGYLSSTVTVTPEAQIDGMNEGDNTGGSVANQVTTFVSGYSVQAGSAVLPALTSTISGTLRNSTTGEALPGMDVSLDMQRVNTLQTHGVGTSASYGTPGYTATTDASGNFTILNAPADSNLRFVVGGYTVDAVSANATGIVVTTNDEVADTYVSDVMVTAIAGGDDVVPFVTNVANTVTAPTATTAMFAAGFDSTAGIDVTFSEPLAATADGLYEVVIRDTTNNVYITLAAPATLSADGKTLSFATATAIPAAAVLEVSILQVDLRDLNGNIADDADVADGSVDYDSIISASNTNVNKYLRLDLSTWQDANLNASAVTGQAQQQTDGTSTDGFVSDSSGLTPAFNDAFDGSLGGFHIQQLNSDVDAGVRLTALATAINGSTVSVESNNARIVFTPSDASYYTVNHSRAGVDITPASIDESSNVNFGTGNDFTVTDANEVAMLIGNAAPGDVVTITPFDDLGNSGTPVSIGVSGVLVDNVEPTTVIQRSYGALPAVEAAAVVDDYGQGGELSQVGGTVLAGTPYLNITMQLLDDTNTAGDDLLDELIAHNAADPVTGDAYLTQPAAFDVYDATAYGVFSANLARTVGVSFSENVTLTGTPATTTSVALSNWVEHNDTSVDDGSAGLGNVNVDLVNVDVADVMALANTDHDSVIDFSDVIADIAGNTGSIAQVVVRDWMPPMITSAVYNGENITLTYSEDIAPAAGNLVTFFGSGGATDIFTLDQATVDAFDLQADKTTLVIPHGDWGGNITWSTSMNLGTYDEGAVLAAPHGGIVTNSIADVNGNTMAANKAGVTGVQFAYYNAIDVMAIPTPVAPLFVDTTAAGSTITFTYTSNHDIDLNATFGGTVAVGATTLTSAEVAAGFTLVSAATIDPTGTGATLSADGRTLTVTVVTATAAVATNDTFTPNVNFVSDYDGSQDVVAATLVVTAP